MVKTELELIGIIDAEVAAAMGGKFSSGELARERARNFNYYLGRQFGNEQLGRSRVVMHDVAEAVDNLMPSLLRIFTTAENVIEFVPVGPEDIEAARQETEVIRNIYWQQNPGFMITYTWLKDALIQKNGIVMATWDEAEEVTREDYEGLTDEELAVLMDDEELEPIERDEKQGPSFVVDPNTGESLPVIVTLHDVTFKRTAMRGRVKIENIPPEEFLVSNEITGLDLDQARFVGRMTEKSRQELIDMGFNRSTVMNLTSKDTSTLDTEEEIARKHLSDETDRRDRVDPLLEVVDLIEGYIKIDFDEDGIVERRQVLKVGANILSNEEVDRQPFHAWSPKPLPHKFFGQGTACQVHDIQLIRSTLVRQMLDNLYLANNPRKVIWEDAVGDTTMDEVLTSRVGGTIRVTKPVNEAIRDENTPFVAGGAFPMLEFFQRVKEDRTGVGKDVQGLSPEAMKNIQTTVVAQLSDLSHMQIETYARVFAETGLKSLFMHIRELLRKNMTKEQVFRLRNQWVPVDPQNWRERKDMVALIGLGTGTREQKLIHLQAVKELQTQLVGAGALGLLVTPQNLYNTAREFARNALFPDPDMFFQDPSTVPPEQAQQIIQQAQGGDGAAEVQAAFVEATREIEAAKAQLEARKQDLDRAKSELQHQREVFRLEQQQGKILADLGVKQEQIDQADRKLDLETEKVLNDFTVQMEQIATKLTELELKFASDVPGSKV